MVREYMAMESLVVALRRFQEEIVAVTYDDELSHEERMGKINEYQAWMRSTSLRLQSAVEEYMESLERAS